MPTPQTFKCARCADCCKYLTIKLYKKDIKGIKRAGYNEDFFMEYDSLIKSPVLRLRNNKCIFLGKKEDKHYCKIYETRPKVCRLYPFVNENKIESCKPNLLKYRFRE